MRLSNSQPNVGTAFFCSSVIAALQRQVRGIAWRLAVRTGMDSRDLEQEGWLGVLEALNILDFRVGEPAAFLVQRARWRMLDAVKRSIRSRLTFFEEVPDVAVNPQESDPERELSRQLNGIQRQIVHLLLAGYTWREVGGELGFSSANVAYHMRKIRCIARMLWPGHPCVGDPRSSERREVGVRAFNQDEETILCRV